MVRECTSQERSHDKGYSPDGPKQAEGERTLGQGDCRPPLGQPSGPGPRFTRKSLGPDHSPMKDIITVQPEKMPATPSPATALKFPRVSGRTTRCGHGKVGTEVARWAGLELTGLPPGRRSLGQLHRSGSPTRRGRWRPGTPTLPRRVHPSQFIRSDARRGRSSPAAQQQRGVTGRYSTHIKALVDSPVRWLER